MSSNHPESATPIPPPSFVPNDVHENMEPSILFPVLRYVWSEQEAITAPTSPCQGPSPREVKTVNTSMSGTLPIYPAATIPKRHAVAKI